MSLIAWAAALGAGAAAAGPLTAELGDPVRGLAVIRDASKASCMICHTIAALPDADQGQLGPALDGVASRLDADELRARIIDARTLAPDTIMPPYHSSANLHRVQAKWVGTTIYTAQEVEDVLAYLLTLREAP